MKQRQQQQQIMTKEELRQIKSWLGRGGIKKLAQDKGLTTRHAYLILRGKVRNFDFIEEAISRAAEQKARIRQSIKELIEPVQDAAA